jgi:hypothetical protein
MFWFILLLMKYIAILSLVVAIVRIDFILGLFDKASQNMEPEPIEVDASDIRSDRETIPVNQDANLKQTPKGTFFALLEDFHTNPVPSIHERAMMILKDNPQMFTQKLDPELESQISRWRDLLNNNNQEAVKFMLSLLNTLQGENHEMMKRFFSLWMEIDMVNFLAAYSQTKDVNCTIAALFGDPIPEEEKINEYYERDDALNAFLAKENINPVHKALATNCLLVIGVEIAKIAPKNTEPENSPGETP